MTFTDIFIRRPVLATVVSLIILFIGIKAYFSLPVRQYPKIDVAAVNVNVTYLGTAADIIESLITTPYENAISGVDGIDYITSASTNGQSSITVYFNLGYDINSAVTDLTSKISAAKWQVPKDAYDPAISKVDPNAQPTIYMTFDSSSMSPENLTDYLYRVIQPQMQVLPGVGTVQVWSAHKYAMRVWLNPYAMAARNITASDIINGLYAGNVRAPSGFLKTNTQEFNINTISDINTPKEFTNLVLSNNNGQLTRLGDVSWVELGSATTRVDVSMDGKPAVFIGITPQITANPLDMSMQVNKYLEYIKQNMPAGMNFKMLIDTADFIRDSIKEVKKTFIEATILVIAIVFLFLGSWRVLLVPVVTIPLSLIGVFGIMLAMGYTINTLTLLALVLAIGMVVDDAIVVAENIYRHIAEGKSPLEAALIGAREIQFAIISITLTLAAVYAPIGFMGGLTGALFKEFAFTLASAVMISGFIALTLSPMMCSKVIVPNAFSGGFAGIIHELSDKLMVFYRNSLEKILKVRSIVVIVMAVIFGGCALLFQVLPSDLAPKEDEGWIFSFTSTPSTANLDFVKKYQDMLVPIYKSVPEGEHFGIISSSSTGTTTSSGGSASTMSFFSLKPWEERKRSVDEIITSLFPKLWGIPGILVFPLNPDQLPGASSFHPIGVALQIMGSYEDLNTITQKVMMEMKKNPAIVNIDADLKMDQLQFNVNIDRNKAGDLGVPVSDIANAINLGFGEPLTTNFIIEGHKYDVMPELEEQYRSSPDLISSLQLRTLSNNLVPLSNLVKIQEKIQPRSLNHFQQLRASTISADLMPGYTMGQALNYIQNIVKKIGSNVSIDYVGQSRQFMQTSGTMLYTFIFALIFIFLVLAAQFESFRDPFIVLFSVPLSTFGALLALFLTHGTLNIYSEIGLVTLVGLISKHGILMVEFANQLQEGGKGIHEAIIEAASIRLRPVLMTTAAMVLGSLPLAFASGAGAISRQQIGWVIVGGMTIGTLFTLFVVPTMYTFFAKKKMVSGDEVAAP